jgi:tetratricopeptide (TPR) repeat protein
MAPLIRAQGTIPDVHPGKTFYLVADETFAGVIATENGRFLGGRPLFRPEDVLRVLADRRLAFMWPALEAWAGPGLAPMQARALADARKRYRTGTPKRAGTTAESSVRPATRALLQLADELDAAGLTEEAMALLREPLAKPPGKSVGDKFDYALTALRLAGIRFVRGDPKGAAEVLTAAGKALPDPSHTLNFDINRASYLVWSGQFAEGLELIDRTLARYVGEQGEKWAPGDDRVPGSMRMFALIRACALNGLGRKDEAAVEMQALLNAPEPRDREFVLANNRTLRFRALLCQREVEPLADFIAEALNGPSLADGLVVWLQRDLESSRIDPALVQAVRAHPKVKAAMATRIRVLGPDLKVVLNRTPVTH